MTAEKAKTEGDIAIQMPTRFLEKGQVAPSDPAAIAAALEQLPPEAIPVPAMCDRHAEELDRELSRALGAAVAPYMVVSLLVFQVATSDPELWRQVETVQQLGRILTLGGCHACRYPRGFRNAMRVVRRRGLHFGAALTRNEAHSAIWRPDVYAVDRR
jgi:hypothetical protein